MEAQTTQQKDTAEAHLHVTLETFGTGLWVQTSVRIVLHLAAIVGSCLRLCC